MTADALKFITPLPFKTLSRHPVVTDLYDEEEGWKPTHIKLADEADLLLIAPATANVMAKMAHGLADDALTCIALALNVRPVASRSRHERQNVAASRHATKRRHPESPWREFIGRKQVCFPAAMKASDGSGRWNKLSRTRS